VDTLKQEIENLHNEAEDLKRQVYRLQLEKDVLENLDSRNSNLCCHYENGWKAA
jgi:cell division protein FtsB